MRPSRAILAARAASRAKRALGRGPVTEACKRCSSQNAVRHGLLSHVLVLGNESGETFAQLLAQHQAKLQPADDFEEGAIGEMASSFWRLRWLWTIETRLFDNCIEKRTETDERDRLAGAFFDLAAGNELNLLDHYENKFHRMYDRSLHRFLVLRALGIDENNENCQTNLDSDKPC
jgi:hypothetical protein